MSLPSPINWIRTNSSPVERLPDHIWILHERYSDTMEWESPGDTWWVQPDYYPDTELGFARAWIKLGSLLQVNPEVKRYGDNCEIHLYLTDEAQEKYQFTDPPSQYIHLVGGEDIWFRFNFNDTSWGAIPSMILGELGVDSNTLNEITNEIQFWIKPDRGRSLQGRLDRANLPLSLRQT